MALCTARSDRARRLSTPVAFALALSFVLTLQACDARKGEESAPAAATTASEGADAMAEAAAAPTPTPAEAQPDPAATAAPFDLAAIPLSTATLPEFPFLDWPEIVPAEGRSVARQADLDAYLVIAGEQLLPIEGRLEQRSFSVPDGHSQLELRRSYEDRIAALGGVRVDQLRPTTNVASISDRVQALFSEGEDPAKRLDLQRYDEGNYEYGVFVVRTAPQTIWFVLQSSQYSMIVTTIEAKAEGA
jgi:hypothetical protein